MCKDGCDQLPYAERLTEEEIGASTGVSGVNGWCSLSSFLRIISAPKDLLIHKTYLIFTLSKFYVLFLFSIGNKAVCTKSFL